MHVILGMIILTVVAIKAHKGDYSSQRLYRCRKTGASYWHMVDLVWGNFVSFSVCNAVR